LRYESEDAAAMLAVPLGLAGALGELAELPQAAAARPMQVITINPPRRAGLLNLGIATIVRP
jgi:hypothetical protein